jgi:hypothetical protein
VLCCWLQDLWDPSTDEYIPVQFGPEDVAQGARVCHTQLGVAMLPRVHGGTPSALIVTYDCGACWSPMCCVEAACDPITPMTCAVAHLLLLLLCCCCPAGKAAARAELRRRGNLADVDVPLVRAGGGGAGRGEGEAVNVC